MSYVYKDRANLIRYELEQLEESINRQALLPKQLIEKIPFLEDDHLELMNLKQQLKDKIQQFKKENRIEDINAKRAKKEKQRIKEILTVWERIYNTCQNTQISSIFQDCNFLLSLKNDEKNIPDFEKMECQLMMLSCNPLLKEDQKKEIPKMQEEISSSLQQLKLISNKLRLLLVNLSTFLDLHEKNDHEQITNFFLGLEKDIQKLFCIKSLSLFDKDKLFHPSMINAQFLERFSLQQRKQVLICMIDEVRQALSNLEHNKLQKQEESLVETTDSIESVPYSLNDLPKDIIIDIINRTDNIESISQVNKQLAQIAMKWFEMANLEIQKLYPELKVIIEKRRLNNTPEKKIFMILVNRLHDANLKLDVGNIGSLDAVLATSREPRFLIDRTKEKLRWNKDEKNRLNQESADFLAARISKQTPSVFLTNFSESNMNLQFYDIFSNIISNKNVLQLPQKFLFSVIRNPNWMLVKEILNNGITCWTLSKLSLSELDVLLEDDSKKSREEKITFLETFQECLQLQQSKEENEINQFIIDILELEDYITVPQFLALDIEKMEVLANHKTKSFLFQLYKKYKIPFDQIAQLEKNQIDSMVKYDFDLFDLGMTIEDCKPLVDYQYGRLILNKNAIKTVLGSKIEFAEFTRLNKKNFYDLIQNGPRFLELGITPDEFFQLTNKKRSILIKYMKSVKNILKSDIDIRTLLRQKENVFKKVLKAFKKTPEDILYWAGVLLLKSNNKKRITTYLNRLNWTNFISPQQFRQLNIYQLKILMEGGEKLFTLGMTFEQFISLDNKKSSILIKYMKSIEKIKEWDISFITLLKHDFYILKESLKAIKNHENILKRSTINLNFWKGILLQKSDEHQKIKDYIDLMGWTDFVSIVQFKTLNVSLIRLLATENLKIPLLKLCNKHRLKLEDIIQLQEDRFWNLIHYGEELFDLGMTFPMFSRLNTQKLSILIKYRESLKQMINVLKFDFLYLSQLDDVSLETLLKPLNKLKFQPV